MNAKPTMGRPRTSQRKATTFYILHTLREELEKRASKQLMTKSSYLEGILEQHLKKHVDNS